MHASKALLLTDVVDSTKLSEQLGDKAMAAVWLAHDRVARDLLLPWRGREIDKTDGMLLLFDEAADALQYALAYHRALASLPVPLKARAGLHVGPVILRENSAEDVARGAKPLEVEGLAKPTAARVMTLARGGQTLLTPDARAALADDVPGLALQSHGHWVMKGVSQPIELFEAGADPSSFAAPADNEKVYRVVRLGDRWLPTREIPNNLPQQSTSFIGRERELDEIKGLLGNKRLVTLLGMGGLGKTRLSLQVAAELRAEYPDGVWFLDLSPISDPALVVSEAAQVLDLREEPGRPLVQTLCAYLAERKAQLIFDNCEHLIKPAADLAHMLLRAAPGVRILASSREALRVPGEHAYPILPLPVPGRHDSFESLSKSTAVRLFVERAQSHKPSFELTERDAPAIAELVERLEGIPLALELAAARVRSLSVADINRRLADRYKLLTGGSRVLQARQQTLRALVDWSHELLTPAEQCVFRRLAAFSGGLDLSAAEAVCGAEPIDSLDAMDLLSSLVEKSLVISEEHGTGTRYRMLETLRDYAQEKLQAEPEDARATAIRHCQHYFAVCKEASKGLRGPEPASWVDQLEAELDNVRAAIALALQGGIDPFVGVKLAVALQRFWLLRGYIAEGRAVVKAALELPAIQDSDVAQAWALYIDAALASDGQGDHVTARRQLEICLVLRRRIGVAVDIAATLSTLTLARLQGGDVSAAIDSEREAMQIFRQLNDAQGEAIGHMHLGQCAAFSGDDEQAVVHVEQGLVIAGRIGHRELEAAFALLRGQVAMEQGDFLEARQWLERSMAVNRASANKRGAAESGWWLGKLELQLGNLPQARDQLATALQTLRVQDTHEQLLGCLEDIARLAHLLGDVPTAVRLCSSVSRLQERLRLVRSPRAERRWVTLLESLREQSSGESLALSGQAGDEWETDEAVQAALAVAGAR